MTKKQSKHEDEKEIKMKRFQAEMSTAFRRTADFECCRHFNFEMYTNFEFVTVNTHLQRNFYLV